MAQTIKLKRSATEGKVPSTGNLSLGEIAINTYDGRIFLKKNDGSDSIQHIIVTNSVTTGSINLNGSFTASNGILVSNDIMPDTDNTLSLGSSTIRFQLNGGTPVTVSGTGTANTITRFQSATTVEDSNIVSSDTATTFTHSNNGNTIFTVSGSNGELLTITDSNTGNLLEVNDASGIDVFTVSATGDVSASGAITASGITGLTSLSVGGTITTNNLTISSLSSQASETTSLMINGSNVVGTRDLGSNAFNSTAFATGDNFDQDGTFASLRAQATTKGDVGLGNVENTALSTYTGENGALDNQFIANGANYITSPDGGNANTLDSIDSSGFIRANADDDVSAHTEWQDSKEIRLGTGNDAQLYHNGTNMFLANGTGNLIIRNNTNDGNVVLQSDNGSGGIDTYLYLDGTNEKVQIDKPTDISDTTQSDAKTTGAFVVDGGVGIAKTLNVGEDVVAFASSDERYKDNVTPIENPNEKLKQIGGYTFDWNDKHEIFKGQHDVGVIAQEIEKVLPEIVETRESGYKAVKYEKIVALLIESNKELLSRVEELESKLK